MLKKSQVTKRKDTRFVAAYMAAAFFVLFFYFYALPVCLLDSIFSSPKDAKINKNTPVNPTAVIKAKESLCM
jgi:hypothetical protein